MKYSWCCSLFLWRYFSSSNSIKYYIFHWIFLSYWCSTLKILSWVRLLAWGHLPSLLIRWATLLLLWVYVFLELLCWDIWILVTEAFVWGYWIYYTSVGVSNVRVLNRNIDLAVCEAILAEIHWKWSFQ